jgi:hypothetical protein
VDENLTDYAATSSSCSLASIIRPAPADRRVVSESVAVIDLWRSGCILGVMGRCVVIRFRMSRPAGLLSGRAF